MTRPRRPWVTTAELLPTMPPTRQRIWFAARVGRLIAGVLLIADCWLYTHPEPRPFPRPPAQVERAVSLVAYCGLAGAGPAMIGRL